jgi:hypothetical protein
MKKLTLFFASVLFVGVTAIYAQSQDTTSTSTQDRTNSSSTSTTDRTKSKSSTSGATQDQSQNYTKDMTRIQSSDVPSNLRTTLQGSQYKGWENGTVYRSKNNDGYAVEIKDGSKTKTYRFDANGKPQP